jgi:hypothetical protein
MKKTLILFLFIAGELSVKAQLKKFTPVQPSNSTTRARMDSVTGQRRLDLRKQDGKDLTIQLKEIQKSTSNFAIGEAGIYTINFDIINSGAEDINIIGTGVQSYIRTSSGFNSPAGGFTLMPPIPNLPANGILHPGDKFHCSQLQYGFNPAANSNNKLIIIIDNSNTVAETNETNNTLEIPVKGNLESWSTPLPDLTFQIEKIAPVTGSTFLNTSINISVVNIDAGEIPLDIVQQIIPLLQVYPSGSPGTNLYNETFPFATRVIANQTYPGYYNVNGPLKPGDKVRIGGSVHINGLTSGANIIFHLTLGTLNNTPLPETNTANNTVDYLYTVQ